MSITETEVTVNGRGVGWPCLLSGLFLRETYGVVGVFY